MRSAWLGPGTARCGLLLVLLASAAACGDDDGPGSVAAGSPDSGPDAATDAGPQSDATIPPIPVSGSDAPPVPPVDAGMDARTTPPDDEDAGVVTCRTLRCESMNDGCNTWTCDAERLRCVKRELPDGTECGSDVLDNCTNPDRCRNGACEPRHQPEGTPCGDENVQCHRDDACDGEGRCDDKGYVPEGTECSTGTPETSAQCDGADTCDDEGVCNDNTQPSTTPCGDQGELCRNDDHCDGFGACEDGGEWTSPACPMGETVVGSETLCACGSIGPFNLCQPAPDVCVAGECQMGRANNGTPCSTGTPETSATCDFPDSCQSGVCRDNAATAGIACNAGTPETNPTCDLPDRCDGGGTCSDNAAGTNVVCGTAPDECHDARRCNGSGGCATAAALPEGTTCGLPEECMLAPACDASGNCGSAQPADPGAACGNPDNSTCDHPDECDGAGGCDLNPEPEGTFCGSSFTTPSDLRDTCDGDGACGDNYAPDGTACGDQGAACLLDDACNEFGQCANGGIIYPCSADLNGLVYAYGQPAVGIDVELLGPGVIATTNAQNSFVLEIPVFDQISLYVEPSPGTFWGSVTTTVLTPPSLAFYMLLVDLDTAVAQWSNVGGLTLDVAKGIVDVSFDGAVGGETVTLGAAASNPVAEVSTGTYGFVTSVPAGRQRLLFFNVTTGNTTVTVNATSGRTCTLIYPRASWPVRARTVTRVVVRCQ